MHNFNTLKPGGGLASPVIGALPKRGCAHELRDYECGERRRKRREDNILRQRRHGGTVHRASKGGFYKFLHRLSRGRTGLVCRPVSRHDTQEFHAFRRWHDAYIKQHVRRLAIRNSLCLTEAPA